MAKVLIDSEILKGIADALRSKLSTSLKYKPKNYANLIKSIKTSETTGYKYGFAQVRPSSNGKSISFTTKGRAVRFFVRAAGTLSIGAIPTVIGAGSNTNDTATYTISYVSVSEGKVQITSANTTSVTVTNSSITINAPTGAYFTTNVYYNLFYIYEG